MMTGGNPRPNGHPHVNLGDLDLGEFLDIFRPQKSDTMVTFFFRASDASSVTEAIRAAQVVFDEVTDGGYMIL